MPASRIILGSRSPRRRELLGLLVSSESIEVRPPLSADELGFEGIASWLEIAQRLQRIAREKNDDVLAQLSKSDTNAELVLTADTMIVASDADHPCHVLGQPPADESWRDVVRGWFHDFYAGRSHIAATAVCLTDRQSGQRLERVVQSHVWFREDVEPLLDWYLTTDEPRGKAGGYALQGLASVFVTRVEGSITNIVGLPLEALIEMLPQFGWLLENSPRVTR
jgi:septum formation protein